MKDDREKMPKLGRGSRCRFSAYGIDYLRPKRAPEGVIVGEGRNGKSWIVLFDGPKYRKSIHKSFIEGLTEDDPRDRNPALDKILNEDRIGYRAALALPAPGVTP